MFCKLCLPEWLPVIGANRESFSVKKGEVIFKEGEEVTGIYFVVEGMVKVHKRWGLEKELIMRFANEGSILGHRGLGNDVYYPVSATALEASVVCFVQLDFFVSSLKVNHDFLYQLMMFFAEELKISERKMRDMVHMSVKGRLATALLALRDKFGVTQFGHINISLSRQDLASYAGTTYETIFRMINELIEENLITNADKKIAIVNEPLLRELISQGNS